MMGWHGSAMTAGSAVGAPVAGFAIDQGGWQWGFIVVSALGVLAAAAGLVGSRTSRRATARAAATDSEHGVAAASMKH
jgi:MFS family permease